MNSLGQEQSNLQRNVALDGDRLLLAVTGLSRASATEENTDGPTEEPEQGDEVVDSRLGRVPRRLEGNFALNVRQSGFRVKVVLAFLVEGTIARRGPAILTIDESGLSASVVLVGLLVVVGRIRIEARIFVPEGKTVRRVGPVIGVLGKERDERVEILVVYTLLSSEEVL